MVVRLSHSSVIYVYKQSRVCKEFYSKEENESKITQLQNDQHHHHQPEHRQQQRR